MKTEYSEPWQEKYKQYDRQLRSFGMVGDTLSDSLKSFISSELLLQRQNDVRDILALGVTKLMGMDVKEVVEEDSIKNWAKEKGLHPSKVEICPSHGLSDCCKKE